ncbi:mt-a70 family protein [Rutstroemia sp. NJR-2017a WRK4]|nr:mt-a70 family protein [Rutstroemia sp. NJR-2017a WRK4]
MSRPHPSHILYQNPSQTLTLIDIPHSIEQAQFISSALSSSSTTFTDKPCPRTRKLISCVPLATPYPSLEPKSQKAIKNLPVKDIDDLLLERYVELSLAELREAYGSQKWCLPRVIGEEEKAVEGTRVRKRKRVVGDERGREDQNLGDTAGIGVGECVQVHTSPPLPPAELDISDPTIFSNPNSLPLSISISKHDSSTTTATLPPHSTLLHGPLPQTLSLLPSPPPQFPLILLDPPWPNRSAHRHASYQTTPDIQSLLSSLPLQDLLSPNGYIAVWLTNKPAFRSLVLDPGGLFAQWGVRLVEEWIWVKVTENGEPVTEVGGRWRRPWEKVVVGRAVGEGCLLTGKDPRGEEVEGEVKKRVIAGVPDIHSRKPNLRYLFEQLLGEGMEGYSGMEIFARNLTAGWWGVGDEVLKFQMEECWADRDSDGNAGFDVDREL